MFFVCTLVYVNLTAECYMSVVLLNCRVVRPPPKRTLSKQLTSKRRRQDELWRFSPEPIKLPLLKKLFDKEELAEEACIMFLDILV